MGKELSDYIRNSDETFMSAAKKSAHLMIPIEGQRYMWTGLRDTHPYVKFLACVGVVAVQMPILMNIYELVSKHLR